jgi:nitrogen fixation/metabolism regulation signal transduction histidine kinase
MAEGDYSLRSAEATDGGALGEVMREVNGLSEKLRQQHLGAVEAAALLRRMLAEVDVAIFSFDDQQVLRLANQRGERLLGKPAERLIGRTAGELGLQSLLDGPSPRILDLTALGGVGRWELRHGIFREAGRPQSLLVLSDLTQALRDEERHAWQRLIDVLRHEINNSLAPIHSLADSLMRLPRNGQREENLASGLKVIADRSASLNRFMASYARLTALPKPALRPVRVEQWVRHAIALEQRMPVAVLPGPDVAIQADGDQLDQLLINLVANAVEAALQTGGSVHVDWTVVGDHLHVRVVDGGPGVSGIHNLFVPFFTTKAKGAGIGLVLCRQIAEAHGGSVSLADRQDDSGCCALVTLPMPKAPRSPH